jgi:hypothetical protein
MRCGVLPRACGSCCRVAAVAVKCESRGQHYGMIVYKAGGVVMELCIS